MPCYDVMKEVAFLITTEIPPCLSLLRLNCVSDRCQSEDSTAAPALRAPGVAPGRNDQHHHHRVQQQECGGRNHEGSWQEGSKGPGPRQHGDKVVCHLPCGVVRESSRSDDVQY